MYIAYCIIVALEKRIGVKNKQKCLSLIEKEQTGYTVVVVVVVVVVAVAVAVVLVH